MAEGKQDIYNDTNRHLKDEYNIYNGLQKQDPKRGELIMNFFNNKIKPSINEKMEQLRDRKKRFQIFARTVGRFKAKAASAKKKKRGKGIGGNRKTQRK